MQFRGNDAVSPGIKSVLAARLPAALSLLGVLCMRLFTAVGGKAQTTTADVVGTVTDSSGAVLPNAKVTVENLATHVAHTAQATSSGEYDVPFLLPGHYSVHVELASFKTFSVSDITLQVGDRARVDAQLQVGDTSQTVEVLAPSPLLQSETSTVSSSITERAVQDIPLPTRNLTTLITYTAGANEGASVDSLSSGQRPDDRRQTSAFSVNGHDVELNNEQLHGTEQ